MGTRSVAGIMSGTRYSGIMTGLEPLSVGLAIAAFLRRCCQMQSVMGSTTYAPIVKPMAIEMKLTPDCDTDSQ